MVVERERTRGTARGEGGRGPVDAHEEAALEAQRAAVGQMPDEATSVRADEAVGREARGVDDAIGPARCAGGSGAGGGDVAGDIRSVPRSGIERAGRLVRGIAGRSATLLRGGIEPHAPPGALDDLEPAVGGEEERHRQAVAPPEAEPDVDIASGAVVVTLKGERRAVKGEVGLALALGTGDETDRVGEGDGGERGWPGGAAVGSRAGVGTAARIALLEVGRAEPVLGGDRVREERTEAQQRGGGERARRAVPGASSTVRRRHDCTQIHSLFRRVAARGPASRIRVTHPSLPATPGGFRERGRDV